MKKLTFALVLFTFNLMVCQTKTVMVFDSSTKLPIEGVSISSNEVNVITNSDGRAAIENLITQNMLFTHLNYENKTIEKLSTFALDSIFLDPKSINLDEILIKTFNLKKALLYVLENYNKLYVDTPFEKQCNFKETVKINGTLKRLILSNISWWDKSYALKKNNVKFRLQEIQYNKNIAFDIFTDVDRLNQPSSSGFINLTSVISTIYLNNLLQSLIKVTDNSQITVENIGLDLIKINFTKKWKFLFICSSHFFRF